VHPQQPGAQLGVAGRRQRQRQFGLALEPGQRRAQLMGGVADEALLPLHAVLHLGQQGVDRTGQRQQLARRRGQLQRRQIGRRPALDLLAQPLERRQPGPDAEPDDQRHQQDQARQRQQHVDQDAPRQLLAVGAAARDLHQQGLGFGLRLAAQAQQQRDHPHRLLGLARPGQRHAAVVEIGLADAQGRARGQRRRRQGLVAQDELARRLADHVEQPVGRIGLEHILRRLRKIDQQAGADRLELARQRAAGLRQAGVDGLVGVAGGKAVGRHAARQPEHQLGQQHPPQQLARQAQAAAAAAEATKTAAAPARQPLAPALQAHRPSSSSSR
jgi:hypothetical protein